MSYRRLYRCDSCEKESPVELYSKTGWISFHLMLSVKKEVDGKTQYVNVAQDYHLCDDCRPPICESPDNLFRHLVPVIPRRELTAKQK